MSVARYGDPFTVSTVADLPLGDEVYAGLFLCSHNPDVVEKAVFRDVRVIRPAKDGFVPYRDYIGSHLEILDLASGHRQLVHSAADPFEAPNWTKDGRALIYNTSGRVEGRGRLFRFDLATRQPALIDTAFANRNNNDHVLSFDGTMLAHQRPEPGRQQVDRLHRPRGRRDAEAHHAGGAVVSARLVAGRKVPRLHRRA